MLGIYAVVTIIVFLKNTYRKYHINYLRNTYRKNLHSNQPTKNYELLIPFEKAFKHADIYCYQYELEECIINGYNRNNFENLLEKAFFHYSYLAKHCLSWFLRIPLPRINKIKNRVSNKVLQFLIFVFTALCDYLLCLFLDKYGLGDKVLSLLDSFLKKLF